MKLLVKRPDRIPFMKAPYFFLLLISALSVHAQTVLDLKFADDTARDAVGGREAELVNVVVMKAGETGYGDFDGRGAVVIPADPELSFSPQDMLWIELWTNVMKVGKSGTLVTKGTGGNYRMAVEAGGNFLFTYYSQGQWRSLRSEEKLALDEWQHLAAWFDSTTGEIRLFLNGRVVGKSSENPPFQSKDDLPLMVGGGAISTGDGYAGISGGIGPVLIARGNPREVSGDSKMGDQAFEVESPF